MPVYEYRCKSCGKTHEMEHGFHDKRPTECPSCGGELVRVFHPIGVVFKGSGFHKTDYGGTSKRPADAKASDAKGSDTKAEPAAASDSSGSAKGSETASTAKPAESKSAETKSSGAPKKSP